ncbi:MAG TPA: LysE family translocator [Acidocella sp.]|nr:LysE family translocator [Acidocella sp.]
MSLHLYAAFVAAVVILMLIPGPNVALITSNSIAHGMRHGFVTVAGTASAMVVQLAVTGLGLEAVLGVASLWLGWLRWLGVLYLIYLGVKLWRTPPVALGASVPPKSAPATFGRAFVVSLTNPKTLFFYSAFFPQFIVPGSAMAAQIALLSVSFMVVALVIDSIWVVSAHRARVFLSRQGRWQNRISGGLLMGAGLGLAIARQK